MGYIRVISYNLFTNRLLASWDIQEHLELRTTENNKHPEHMTLLGAILGCPAGFVIVTIVIVSWFISPSYGMYPTYL